MLDLKAKHAEQFSVSSPLRIAPYLELLRHVVLMITAMQRKRVGRRKHVSSHANPQFKSTYGFHPMKINIICTDCANEKNKQTEKRKGSTTSIMMGMLLTASSCILFRLLCCHMSYSRAYSTVCLGFFLADSL